MKKIKINEENNKVKLSFQVPSGGPEPIGDIWKDIFVKEILDQDDNYVLYLDESDDNLQGYNIPRDTHFGKEVKRFLRHQKLKKINKLNEKRRDN